MTVKPRRLASGRAGGPHVHAAKHQQRRRSGQRRPRRGPSLRQRAARQAKAAYSSLRVRSAWPSTASPRRDQRLPVLEVRPAPARPRRRPSLGHRCVAASSGVQLQRRRQPRAEPGEHAVGDLLGRLVRSVSCAGWPPPSPMSTSATLTTSSGSALPTGWTRSPPGSHVPVVPLLGCCGSLRVNSPCRSNGAKALRHGPIEAVEVLRARRRPRGTPEIACSGAVAGLRRPAVRLELPP